MTRVRMLAVLSLLFAGVVHAAIDVYEFPDPQTEHRFRELTHELRCPKCQNQNINDSSAPLAHDIKDRVHKMLLEGRSNDEITDFMVERYGEFVTYKPRMSLPMLLLWSVPALAALVSIGLLWSRTRRSPEEDATPGPDQRKLDALLEKYASADHEEPR